MKLIFLVIYFLCFINNAIANDTFDPYKILGVYRSSSADDIRKAYKKLAREWHPDKNKDESAGERFTEINRAYEILGDDRKRQEYDKFGRVDESPMHQSSEGGQRAQFVRTPFGDFYFNFDDMFPGGQKQRADIVTDRYLEQKILPGSFKKPFLFFATTDFCFACMRIQPLWNQFTEELKSIDLQYGIVDVDYEPSVARKLKVPRIPCIGALVNGRSVIFEASEYNIKTLRDFVRKLFPDDIINEHELNVATVDDFLSGWKDNRARAIFFGLRFQPSVRLLAAISQFKEFYKLAYVDTSSVVNNKLLERFDVSSEVESMIIFHENILEPVYAASASQKQFSASEIEAAFSLYKYLDVPRLNRPSTWDELCPVNSKDSNTKACVILTIHSSHLSGTEFEQFYLLAKKKSNLANVKFLYLITDVQKSLVDALKRPEVDFTVLVLARKAGYEVYYSWVEWCLDSCHTRMESVADKMNLGLFDFPKRNLKRFDIRDEFQASLFYRIVKRIFDWWDFITYTYFEGDSMLTAVTFLSTVMCAIIMGFFFKIIGSQAEARADHQAHLAKKPSYASSSLYAHMGTGDKFTVYDLRSHNYDKLVRDAPFGYRLILLLVDSEHQQEYLKRFADLCMPFNRAPYFYFGFCLIDKYISWYQMLLSQTIGFQEQLCNIQPELCVGTVLAINGKKKYYHIYHPKTLNLKRNDQQESSGGGDFIGFDDEENSDSEREEQNGHFANGNGCHKPVDGDAMLLEGRCLDGLGNWIDRLFDGSLPKCKIERWPKYPVDEEENRTETNKKDS